MKFYPAFLKKFRPEQLGQYATSLSFAAIGGAEIAMGIVFLVTGDIWLGVLLLLLSLVMMFTAFVSTTAYASIQASQARRNGQAATWGEVSEYLDRITKAYYDVLDADKA